MQPRWHAKYEFRFYSSLHLFEITGRKAKNLKELVKHLREVDDSVIFNHTHTFVIRHHFLTPEPPSAFTHWVKETLKEEWLGEQLEGINTIEFTSLKELREKIVSTIDSYMKKTKKTRTVPEGEEFFFLRSIEFVFPTPYVANNIYEFVEALRVISPNSLYFHFFTAKLRLGKGTNDFSYWIETSLGEKDLAQSISQLDPYMYTLEELREVLIGMLEKEIHQVLRKAK
jgi:hypothetical protein